MSSGLRPRASKQAPICMPPRTIAVASRAYWERARSKMPSRRREAATGPRNEGQTERQRAPARGRCRTAQDAARHFEGRFPAGRQPCRLRARRVRRLHGPDRRRAVAGLPDVRGPGRRLRDHDHRGIGAGARRTEHRAGCVLRNPRPAMRLLHARHDPDRARAADAKRCADTRRHRRGDLRQYLPLHRLRADRRGGRICRRSVAKDQRAARSAGRGRRWAPSRPAGEVQGAAGRHSGSRSNRRTARRPLVTPTMPLKFVSSNRRVREDRRFVAGQGRYVADIALEGLLHVAVVPSQYPAARIVSINSIEAMKMPGVHYALTGEELAKAVDPLMNGLETPNVRRYPLAVGQVRYVGEWVVAVVAETRAQAEDAAEKVRVEYEPLPYVIDAEEALDPSSPPVHPPHGSNLLLDKTFVWGEVEKHFAESPRHLSFRVVWGRSSTVPIETFGVAAKWDPWREMLDVWASIQMPKYSDQIARSLRIPLNNVRVHQDVDVGGSYGVKRGIKQTVIVAHLARILGRPVRLIEDRLDNMRAGDAHGPDRIFDVEVAFNDDCIVKSMKMRALDNVGAYAGRSPFQLGKPIGAIVGPYKIQSVQYRAISVTSNKAAQEAVRGFGQAPTNYAIETAIDKVAAAVGLDRIEIRRRNFIRSDEFPYLIPSGTHYDSGDYHAVVAKVLAHADYEALKLERDALRAAGLCAGIGIAACLEPSGGNSSFEPLLNEKNTTTTWMDSCRINVDGLGFVTATIHTTSAGQGHETLAATVIGEVLEIDPDLIRIVRPDTLS